MDTALSLPNEPHLKTTRVRFKNVLVAIDLSASSANTLQIATEVARRHGALLVVAHVLHGDAKEAIESPVAVEARIRLWMKPYLKGDARYSIAVVEGDVLNEISGLVKQYCADLLIIGTHAATNVERLVLGSKAEALFRNMSIPVLTIGPHVRHCSPVFSSILLPTNLEPDSLRATQYAVSLAEEANATLTLLHVPAKAAGAFECESARLRMEELLPADAALWCKPVFRVEPGDLGTIVLGTAEEVRADLIVMSVTHARLLADHAHWSTASKVVRFAECPVLTVRDHL